MCKRSCVFVLFGVVGFSSSLAASEPSSPPSTWEGVYIGVHAGYGWGDSSSGDGGTKLVSGKPPFGAFSCGPARTGNYCNSPLDLDPEGVFGGLQLGVNWQRGQLVFGLEGDLGKLNISEHKTLYRPFNDQDIASVNYKGYGTVTGRIGYDLGESLIYLKGGLAIAEIENTAADIDNFKIYPGSYTRHSGTETGWALGGGWERYLTDQVSVKAEYLYMDFGSVKSRSPDGDVYEHENDLHTVKVGLNFHANARGGAPLPGPSTTYDWSGVYVGAHGGYGAGDTDYILSVNSVVTEKVSHDADGWLYGGHVGIQRQVGRWVAGLEASYSDLDYSDTAGSQIGGGRFRTVDIDSLFTATARFGLARDSWLAYVKGGYATADVETAIFKTGGVGQSVTSGWDGGWTVGAGIEFSCLPRVIVGLEYDFVKLDVNERSGVLVDDKKGFTYSDFDTDIHSVVARVSYKFGDEPSPVPLK